jgi:hypothetical protein
VIITTTLTRTYEPSGDTVPGRSKGLTVGSDYAVTYGYDPTGRFNTLAWNASGRTDTATYGYVV